MHKDRHVYRLIFVHISNYVPLRAFPPLAGRKKASLTKREAFHTGIIMGTHPYRLISSSKPHHIGLIQGRCRGAERVVPLYLSHSRYMQERVKNLFQILTRSSIILRRASCGESLDVRCSVKSAERGRAMWGKPKGSFTHLKPAQRWAASRIGRGSKKTMVRMVW